MFPKAAKEVDFQPRMDAIGREVGYEGTKESDRVIQLDDLPGLSREGGGDVMGLSAARRASQKCQ